MGYKCSPRITQPCGAATPRNSDAHKRIAVPKAFCVLWEHPRPRPKSGKTCRSDTRPGDVGERAERSESSDTPPSETPPVSACKPLYAIFLRKASVYPLSPVKANVGRLCEKLKNAIGSDLEQRCGGNFWRYLRERYWTKSRTLQEGFSGGEGRSILVQDKGPQSQASAARPQSPAVRGFPRF